MQRWRNTASMRQLAALRSQPRLPRSLPFWHLIGPASWSAQSPWPMAERALYYRPDRLQSLGENQVTLRLAPSLAALLAPRLLMALAAMSLDAKPSPPPFAGKPSATAPWRG